MMLSVAFNQHISEYQGSNASNTHCNSDVVRPPIPHSQYNVGQYQHCRY